MRPLIAGHKVRYVTADAKIIDATITEPQPPLNARVEWGDKHGADATYNEDRKTPNTFHFPDVVSGEPVEPPKPAPFTPGAAAK